ncbi:hypothetical protein [Pseudomonas sp. PDM31]|uniref:hypothetical protein n=1 Tax=Pseudomonas sp. PDM31 TaxID=2854778 RepID=UPI001C474ECC|nr:hypothetical protein [Pseudomonas sp. PDM31]MBV7480347.1 hypothetical protein [Pseudomonas sp. PDM31]
MTPNETKPLEFYWWEVFGLFCLGFDTFAFCFKFDPDLWLALGSDSFAFYLKSYPYFLLWALGINGLLCWGVFRFNKWAFLILTVCHPFFWIVNIPYLKNRWRHPQVNGERQY